MGNLGDSLHFFLSESEIAASLGSERSFFLHQIKKMENRVERIVDFVRERGDQRGLLDGGGGTLLCFVLHSNRSFQNPCLYMCDTRQKRSVALSSVFIFNSIYQ